MLPLGYLTTFQHSRSCLAIVASLALWHFDSLNKLTSSRDRNAKGRLCQHVDVSTRGKFTVYDEEEKKDQGGLHWQTRKLFLYVQTCMSTHAFNLLLTVQVTNETTCTIDCIAAAAAVATDDEENQLYK